jgi:protein-disulfide isomerase
MIRLKLSLVLIMVSILTLILVACGTAGPAVYNDDQETGNDSQENVEENKVSPAEPSPDAPGSANQFNEAESENYDGNIQIGFTADGHAYRGDLNAPVVIEEFSDFQCPYCTRFSEQTLPSLDRNQIADGEVLLIYYDFPLESIHPQAFAAANAARCAGDQGALAYWNMHNLLYSSTQQWSISNPIPVFSRFAEELDLDTEEFTSCLESNKYQEQIQADLDLAAARGVRSTPSFFVNGDALVGAQPVEVFDQVIIAARNGESIAEAAGDPAEAPLPLEPPRVAPTPAIIPTNDAAATLGDPNAPVTIVEYTDYQCPFCQRHVQETMPGILSDMIDTGRVHYVLKDLPLDNLHPEARTAALVARCAGEQDAYWPMHDAIFAETQSWSGQGEAAADLLISLASSLNLDEEDLNACVEEKRYADEIQANIDEANSMGASATPYFFINGMPIPGAQPYELFFYAVGLAEEGMLADAFETGEPDVSESFSMGDPDAPVVIIEYTDFQCPYCSRHFEQTFSQIKENFVDEGLVYYIFKDFPLTNIHPQAVKAAEAARCAGEQDFYLQMHGKLFSSQSEWSGNSNASEVFITYAEDLGLDTDSFASCLESGQYEAAVMEDLDEGSQLGVNGTPAFFINGYSMSGAQPYQIFEQAINQFLAEQ